MKYKLITIDKLHVFDTHIHSMSHGALMKVFTTEEVMKLIDKCAARKVQTICLTDHIPLPTTEIDPTPDKDCGLPMQNFIDVLVTNRDKLKKYAKQKNIRLLLGGEFDFFADARDYYDDLDQMYKPEFKVLGQHFIDTIVVNPEKTGFDCYGEKIAEAKEKLFCFDFSENVFIYGVKQKGSEALVKRYFELLEESIALQTYDSVAHIDLITKYNTDNKYFKEDENYKKQMITILLLVKKKNMLLEINLGGIKATKRLVPNEWIIKEAMRLNIPLTIGSDAHGYENNTELFSYTKKILKNIGVRKIAVPYL